MIPQEIKDFIATQAPEVLEQSITKRKVELKYDMLAYSFCLILSMVGLFVAAFWPEHGSDAVAARLVGGGIAALFFVAFTVAIINALSNFQQLKVAPKAYVLERYLEKLRGNND